MKSNYCTGVPQASGMFHWGSASPKRLKTTDIDKSSRDPIAGIVSNAPLRALKLERISYGKRENSRYT